MASSARTVPPADPVPGRVPLTQERIVAAALELADTKGDFSMRALGEKLAVDPMAIYRHFEDKNALLDALIDAALKDLRPSRSSAGPAPQRLRQLCLDFRQALKAHPGVAFRIRSNLPVVGPHVIELTEASLGLLCEVGVAAAEAPRDLMMLIRFITATVEEEEQALAAWGTERAWREAAKSRYDSLSSTDYPGLTAMASQLQSFSFTDDFERGLDLLLEAIIRRGAQDD